MRVGGVAGAPPNYAFMESDRECCPEVSNPWSFCTEVSIP